MRKRRILPHVYARVSCPLSRPILYMPDRNDSRPSPSSSIVSSFCAIGLLSRKSGARRALVSDLADGYDVLGLGAFLPLGGLELDLRPFGEGLVTLRADRAEMHEDVLAALIRG